MNYTVDWSKDALDLLGAVWLVAPDRSAVTRAQALIDQRLSANPLAHAKPVSEGLYAIDVAPLRAIFELDDDARRVDVVGLSKLP
jgi:mRNA-degrading endonuclease RelE of RelBE toxin-antitoxin system